MDSFLMFDGRSSFTSLETILFIKEVIEVNPEHRQAIFEKICDSFEDIRSHLVIRAALWIVGEYASSPKDVEKAFETIKRNVGALPLFKEGDQTAEEAKAGGPKVITKTIILPDGSYGTETIVVDDPAKAKAVNASLGDENIPLRKHLLSSEDDYIGSCLAISLTKLCVKMKKHLNSKFNQMAVDAILVICAVLKQAKKKDLDSQQRMQLCLRILTNPSGLSSLSAIEKVLVDQGKLVFAKFLENNSRLGAKKGGKKDKEKLLVTQPDEMVVFRQLKGRTGATDFDITEEISGDGGFNDGNEDFLGEVRKDVD